MINCKKKLDQILERILLLLESVIALISICVLAGMLVIFLLDIFQNPSFFQQKDAVHLFLQELLAIVIGLEFVKLLMHMTPANILEVLSMAIARHIVVGHGGALDNLMSILCIVAMFAAKRYLIPPAEFHMELESELPEKKHHRHKHSKNKHSADNQETSETQKTSGL